MKFEPCPICKSEDVGPADHSKPQIANFDTQCQKCHYLYFSVCAPAIAASMRGEWYPGWPGERR